VLVGDESLVVEALEGVTVAPGTSLLVRSWYDGSLVASAVVAEVEGLRITASVSHREIGSVPTILDKVYIVE
jgi:hypothetical protein